MKKLKPFIVNWLAALRSGKFNQGQAYLKIHQDNQLPRYCCLGVLCETLEIAQDTSSRRLTSVTDETDKTFTTVTGFIDQIEKITYYSALPGVVKDQYGFNSQTGAIKYIRINDKPAAEVMKAFLLSHSLVKNTPLQETISHIYSLSLANLNDINIPFNIIADLIEEFPYVYIKEPYENI